MKRTEFREAEENLIWKWVHEELPKQFGFDTDDTIGHENVMKVEKVGFSKTMVMNWNSDLVVMGCSPRHYRILQIKLV